MKTFQIICVVSLIFATSCTKKENKLNTKPTPPVAEKKENQLEKFDDIRQDNYFWLNDREDPEVIDYLERENEYNDQMTAHTKGFQKQLFEEMKARIKEDDASVPYKYNGYWYITRYEKGKDYPIYSRKKETLDAEEEILFDCNKEAKGHSYYRLVGLNVSPDNTRVAFGVDTVSRRQYTIQIKNLVDGTVYDDTIENATGSSTWAADGKTLFYTKKDAETLLNIFGTPSDLSPLIICSLKNTSAFSFSPIKLFSNGLN